MVPVTNANWSIEVVSTPSADSSTSYVIHFDSQRYIFNSPEGFTRVVASTGLPLRKATSVFLSRIHSDAVGGLAGEFRIDYTRLFPLQLGISLNENCRAQACFSILANPTRPV
jgi:ribonuclease BN (tRNA processing enzyme)